MPVTRSAAASRLSPPRRGRESLVRDLDARVGSSIKLAEQALMAEKSRVLRPFDLSVAQYATMLSLYYVPGQSAAQLARAAMVTPQTMATILARLDAKGLVVRVRSEVHSKVLIVTLTPSGEALLLRADDAARAVEQRLRDVFTDEQAEQLSLLLRLSVQTLRTQGDGPADPE